MDPVWTHAWSWLPAAAGVALAAAGLAVARRRRVGLRAGEPAALDPVSGLPARAVFDDALDEAAHRCDREGGTLAVLYLGLDDFHLVAHRHGPTAGDRVLALVPERLFRAVPGLIGATRTLGDEFALALVGDAEQARTAAQRLRDELRRPFRVDGEEVRLDASLGIALYPQHGARSRLLLQAAAALRAARQAGGGAYALFEPAMGVDMRQRTELLRDLRRALEDGALQLVWQPRVHARTLQVTAVEALLRWHDPRRGIVPPSVFLPLAEAGGLLDEIGPWVLEQACAQAAAWAAEGLPLRVAVNLSARQLRQDDAVARIAAALERHGLPPTRLVCEVPAASALEDTRAMRHTYELLHDLGATLSVDDVGGAGAPIEALARLPVAEVNIDRALIGELDRNDDARGIVATLIRLAHDAELRVVAEGVETQTQRDWLLHMRCDEMQGYLFAKPMSATALAVWTRSEIEARRRR